AFGGQRRVALAVVQPERLADDGGFRLAVPDQQDLGGTRCGLEPPLADDARLVPAHPASATGRSSCLSAFPSNSKSGIRTSLYGPGERMARTIPYTMRERPSFTARWVAS